MKTPIVINPSPTADTRSCDFANVSRSELIKSSVWHIADVKRGLRYISQLLMNIGTAHDADKIEDIYQFHSDFVSGFESTKWWDAHKVKTRHHLQTADGVPDDVNLLDVLECVVDCVMAGKARTGNVTPITIDDQVLQKALANTVNMLMDVVEVKEM